MTDCINLKPITLNPKCRGAAAAELSGAGQGLRLQVVFLQGLRKTLSGEKRQADTESLAPKLSSVVFASNESGFLPGAKLSASELQQGAGAGSYFRAMPGQSAFIKPAGASEEDASPEVHRGQPQGLRRGGCKLFCTICPERFSSAARRMKMKRRAPQPGSEIKQPSASRDKSLFCLGCWVSARGQPSQFLGL